MKMIISELHLVTLKFFMHISGHASNGGTNNL